MDQVIESTEIAEVEVDNESEPMTFEVTAKNKDKSVVINETFAVPEWMRKLDSMVDMFPEAFLTDGMIAFFKVKLAGSHIRPMLLAGLSQAEIQLELENLVPEFHPKGGLKSWQVPSEIKTVAQGKAAIEKVAASGNSEDIAGMIAILLKAEADAKAREAAKVTE
jgi:hypothetical protein